MRLVRRKHARQNAPSEILFGGVPEGEFTRRSESEVLVSLTQILINTREVCELLGVSRTTLYRRMAAGSFPLPANAGERNHLWNIREVEAWVEAGMPALKEWQGMKKANKRKGK